MSKNSEMVKLEYNLQGGSETCPKNPSTRYIKPSQKAVLNEFKNCKTEQGLINLVNYLHKGLGLKKDEIKKTLINEGYNSEHFSKLGHEFNFYGIYNVSDWETANKVYPNISLKQIIDSGYPEYALHLSHDYSIESILDASTYPVEALGRIIKAGEKKGLTIDDFLHKDRFSQKHGKLYKSFINEKYGEYDGIGKGENNFGEKLYTDGYAKLRQEAEEDIKNGSTKFGHVDISWMDSLGYQAGGRYEINYSI